jgi:predicted transcriptional regulator
MIVEDSAADIVPPPLELRCLNALWELGQASVVEVRRLVPRNPVLAYTTVLTLLDRLVKRGLASRFRDGRGFRYMPVVDRKSIRLAALKTFLDQHFGGCEMELRRFLDEIAPLQQPLSPLKAFAAVAGAASSSAGLRVE